MTIFEDLESQVRSYSRNWPVVFDRAVGNKMYDEDGNEYLDFFSGAGALNYGHNNPILKKTLIDYLSEDRVFHSLDMFTTARREFLETFSKHILEPRNLDYKVIFPGPGGANAVEAALKLVRKVTGREQIINFTNSFHGMTLGALSVTGNALKRGGAGVPLVHATPMPFDDYFDGDYPDFFYFEKLLLDSGSGLNKPAAVIVETVQGEGGINAARIEWLRGLSELCKKHDIFLIIDDIQMGCGRTGDFFSFEEAGIKPDIVCLSKSISGYGFPMALTLVRPDLDIWEPGEHNGTFRGISPAFMTASEAIRTYWSDDKLAKSTKAKGLRVESRFNSIIANNPDHEMIAKGRGLARGIQFSSGEIAGQVCAEAFKRGMLLETSGPEDEVMKILPALTITDEELERGLQIIEDSIDTVLATAPKRKAVSA
ncbi:MAG TPA: diaminobutyrate--2-oxoglutarate transaminase [Microbacteriaceae bacterium]|nr:diaminobutyrate--2-oxoglutarate transaminase [Microbacteriaceae bacterium]